MAIRSESLMPKSFLELTQIARDRSLKRRSQTYVLLQKALSKWKLTDEQRELLHALLGKDAHAERLLASDLHGLLKAAEVFCRLVNEWFDQHPGRTFFFATFTDSIGDTLDRMPIIRLKAFQDKVERAIRSHKLDAFIVNGLHPFVNYPAGKVGRQLSLDAHALLWTDQPFDHKEAQKAFNTSGVWQSALTHKPVEIKPFDRAKLADFCHYLFKPWHDAKNRMPRKDKPGKIRLYGTHEGYRPDLALRVAEGRSQLQLLDLVAGIGNGRSLRQAFRAEMISWHRKRQQPVLISETMDTWQLWLDLRSDHGSSKYKPYRFDVGTAPFMKSTRAVSARRRRGRNAPPKRMTRRLGKASIHSRRRRPSSVD